MWGLTVFNALLLGLAFLFFYSAIKNFLWEKLLAIGLTIFLAWGIFSFGIRSQLLSLFFFNLLLYLTKKFRQNTAITLFCPLVILLWANFHGGSVILGLVILAFIFLSFSAQSFSQLKKVIFLIGVFFLSIFVTFLNPFGPKIYQEAWQHFAGIDLSKLIAEWVPPPPTVSLIVILSALGLFLFSIFSYKKEVFILSFLLLPLAYLALKARRHLPFYLFIWFYLFFQLPTMKKLVEKIIKDDFLRQTISYLLIFLLLGFGLFIRLPLTIQANSSWQNYCQENQVVYPCSAIEFLRGQPPANIFNRYEWGGFLIWQLPEYKIFVDGRMPAWLARRSFSEGGPVSPYTIYLETLQTQPGWQETLKSYNINWILISPGTFMDLKLRPDPGKFGWQEAYRDKDAVIYGKSN